MDGAAGGQGFADQVAEGSEGQEDRRDEGHRPFLFLLRSLHQEGLSKSDVEILALQHADGRAALEQGRVDAWAASTR
jgi:sulfonate transport system substrate-binding protein